MSGGELHPDRPPMRDRWETLAKSPGKLDAVRRRASRLSSRTHDLVRGVQTHEVRDDLGLTDNGVNSAHGTSYEPSFYGLAKHVLRNVPFQGPHHLVDYGSGRGRMMLAAQEMRFASATGVEYSDDLHQQAVRNLQAARFFKSSITEMAALHVDAAQYEVRAEQNIFYFYNPFGPAILDQVLDRVEESLERRPRQCWFAYTVVKHPEVFSERGFKEVEIPDWRGISARSWVNVL